MHRSALALLAVSAATGCLNPMRGAQSTGSSVAGGTPSRATISGSAAPPAFVRSTSDARVSRILDVREGLGRSTAFRAASEILAQKFTVDVSDPRAGFLMTTWQASYVREGVPDLRYRTRLVVRFLGEDWKQVSVRAEANWQRGDEWEIGFDAALLDQVVTELRARIGKKS